MLKIQDKMQQGRWQMRFSIEQAGRGREGRGVSMRDDITRNALPAGPTDGGSDAHLAAHLSTHSVARIHQRYSQGNDAQQHAC